MEDVTLIEVVLSQVADRKTNNAAEVAHFLGLEDVVEAELKPPEDHSRYYAHDGIEGESLGVVGDAACPKAKDVALVKNVLEYKAHYRSNNNRDHDLVGIAVCT